MTDLPPPKKSFLVKRVPAHGQHEVYECEAWEVAGPLMLVQDYQGNVECFPAVECVNIIKRHMPRGVWDV